MNKQENTYIKTKMFKIFKSQIFILNCNLRSYNIVRLLDIIIEDIRKRKFFLFIMNRNK
jgi:hypothetical protein